MFEEFIGKRVEITMAEREGAVGFPRTLVKVEGTLLTVTNGVKTEIINAGSPLFVKLELSD